jgi:2-polyprenyl-3-methyl-5-hydroxy-6-metoxy-1,4-benzoquinol methylase
MDGREGRAANLMVHATQWVCCPNCGADDAEPWAEENGFTAVKCSPCGLIYVNPRPSEESISQANKIGVHQGEERAVDVKARREPRKVAHYRSMIVDMFAPEIVAGKPLRWLDVGAGYGEVVEAAAAVLPPGSEVEGIEPMAPKVAVARSFGLPVADRSLEDAGTGYDVISLINVYSHVPNFDRFAGDLVAKLNRNGVMFIETGNIAELKSRKDLPDILYLPDHLVFAGLNQMKQILARLGMVLENHKSLRFDTPLWCAKMFIKRAMQGELAIHLPGRSALRTVFYKARKPA